MKKRKFPKIIFVLAAIACVSPYAYEKYKEYKINNQETKQEIWIATSEYESIEGELTLSKNATGYQFGENGSCTQYTFNGDSIYVDNAKYELVDKVYKDDSYVSISIEGNYISNEESCTYKIENGTIYITKKVDEEYQTISGYYTKEDHIKIKWSTNEVYNDYYSFDITPSPVIKMSYGTVPLKYIYDFAVDTFNPYNGEEGISYNVDLSTFASHFIEKHQAQSNTEDFVKLNMEYTSGIEYTNLYTDTNGYKQYVSAAYSNIWKLNDSGQITVYTPVSKLTTDETITDLEIAYNTSNIYIDSTPIEDVTSITKDSTLSVEITLNDYIKYLNDTITKEYNIEGIEVPEEQSIPVSNEQETY